MNLFVADKGRGIGGSLLSGRQIGSSYYIISSTFIESDGLWHLEGACTKHFCGPLRTRQAAGGKGLQLPLYVVLDSSDRWCTPIKNQIGCAGITVVGKANASGIDQEP